MKTAERPVKRSSRSRVSSPIARNGSVSSTRSSGCTQQVESYERHSGVTDEHVIKVPVGEHHGYRLEAVLHDQLGDTGHCIHSRIDDHALGAGPRQPPDSSWFAKAQQEMRL